MEYLTEFFNFIMHIDKYIKYFVDNYGILTYFILFIIIYCETGLLIFFFLPAESLLFASGALLANGNLNILVLTITLTISAILGYLSNYYIGKKFGDKIIKKGIIKQNNLNKIHNFIEKHGGKTILYARFIPVVRTLAPFIIGGSNMNDKYFLKFNVLSGILWVVSFLVLGYFFGNIFSIVHKSTLIITGVIFLFLSFIFILSKKYRFKK